MPGLPRRSSHEGADLPAGRSGGQGPGGRLHDYLKRSFLPGRRFAGPAGFNAQWAAWLEPVNTRTRRALGCAPSERIAADLERMLPLPPVAPATGRRASTRLARDHYLRLDGNDYGNDSSVHPTVSGRRVEVLAELCRSTSPNFALALGRHADMFAEARFLIEHGIPFAMEKPCGLDAGEVAELARRCREARHFAAVPFVWRQSELLREMRARFADSSVRYMSLRWIAGPPSRYVDSGCEWMLDPRQAGGGCTINLSVHLIDLARVVLGTTPRVAAAVMSNAAYGLPIEDYSLIVLQSGARTVVVETGYLVPGPHSKVDMHFSIKADDCYLMATGPEDVELVGPDGGREHVRAFTTNVPHYPVFVRETLERLSAGRPPVASMSDMAEVMEVVEAAYELGGLRSGLSTS